MVGTKRRCSDQEGADVGGQGRRQHDRPCGGRVGTEGPAEAARRRSTDPGRTCRPINLSRRTICYLLKVWETFSDLGIPRERLVRLVGPKRRSSSKTVRPRRWRRRSPWRRLATAKELPALLKGRARKAKARTVQLRLTPRQYDQFAAVLLANGARRPRGERGLSGKEKALMKALGH